MSYFAVALRRHSAGPAARNRQQRSSRVPTCRRALPRFQQSSDPGPGRRRSLSQPPTAGQHPRMPSSDAASCGILCRSLSVGGATLYVSFLFLVFLFFSLFFSVFYEKKTYGHHMRLSCPSSSMFPRWYQLPWKHERARHAHDSDALKLVDHNHDDFCRWSPFLLLSPFFTGSTRRVPPTAVTIPPYPGATVVRLPGRAWCRRCRSQTITIEILSRVLFCFVFFYRGRKSFFKLFSFSPHFARNKRHVFRISCASQSVPTTQSSPVNRRRCRRLIFVYISFKFFGFLFPAVLAGCFFIHLLTWHVFVKHTPLLMEHGIVI